MTLQLNVPKGLELSEFDIVMNLAAKEQHENKVRFCFAQSLTKRFISSVLTIWKTWKNRTLFFAQY